MDKHNKAAKTPRYLNECHLKYKYQKLITKAFLILGKLYIAEYYFIHFDDIKY